MAYIPGGPGNDVLEGFEDSDDIYGWEGRRHTLRQAAATTCSIGDSGADRLYGDWGNDTLNGGSGADLLHGGSGNDTADVSVLRERRHRQPGHAARAIAAHAAGDRLISIENLFGSYHVDVLIGDEGVNVLDGWRGNDVLLGGGGGDRLIGGDGNDFLQGGAGADRIEGGDGIDTADYYASASGVYVDLGEGYGVDGDAEGDLLDGVENLQGSTHADSLLGNNQSNAIVRLRR